MPHSPFTYTAILDHEHLDNGLFLKSMAEAVSRQGDVRGIFLHGDSAYTDRIMQTGVLREEARLRSIRELNRRLVALMADSGIASIGINGFQKDVVTLNPDNNLLEVDTQFITNIPQQTCLILSNLISGKEGPYAYPLPPMAEALKKTLNLDAVFAFRMDEKPGIIQESFPGGSRWSELDGDIKNRCFPEEIRRHPISVYLTDTYHFRRLPELDKSSLVVADT